MNTPTFPPIALAGEPVAWQYENQHGNPFLTHKDPSTWHPHDRAGFKNFVALGVIAAPSPSASSVPVAHCDDRAVDEFARLMKEKMAISRANGRYGWNDPNECSIEDLTDMLHASVAKGDPVDVANFCMMLRHYDAKIAAPPANPAPSVLTDEQIMELWKEYTQYGLCKDVLGYSRALLQANGATK